MMRLIDADKLRKDVLDLPNCYNGFSDAYGKSMIIDLVDEQPTVDAEPVVRCKDCRYRYQDGANFCLLGTQSDEWFCADGERREDGKTD